MFLLEGLQEGQLKRRKPKPHHGRYQNHGSKRLGMCSAAERLVGREVVEREKSRSEIRSFLVSVVPWQCLPGRVNHI